MKIERSLLFVPGNRPDRFDKAASAGADSFIIDLEDAVAPADKFAARAALARWLRPSHQVYVRVNATPTKWFQEDCAIACLPGVSAVVLPKTEGVEDVLALRRKGVDKPVLALIETAKGFCNMRSIARAPGVVRLVFGSIDFQLDLGMSGNGVELMPYRCEFVLASKLAGIAAPVDGVWTSISDAVGLAAEASAARRLGFGAKLCIHPKQVPTVNHAFGPSQVDVAWARRIVSAVAASGGSAITVDGEMIDRPLVARATGILEEARQRHDALGGAA